MRGLPNSKRVSWATDINLCQVRLFLSEESPSQVGLNGQDHLQAKASWPSHSTGTGSDDNLPPGFEGIQPANLLKNKLSQIPVIRWKCPPRFALDFTWQVVAGEESKELEVENQREMRVLEAVYPRPSAIPPNPALLMGVEGSYHNDEHTPLIPITPIEDEDAGADSLFDNNPAANNTLPMSSQPQQLSDAATLLPQLNAARDMNHAGNGIPPGVEPDVVSAAYSALNAAMVNNDQENLIDPNLLIKILSNPQMIEKLVMTHGASANPQLVPKPMTPGISLADAPPVHPNTMHAPFSSAASSSGTFYPPPSRVGPVPISNMRPPPPPPLPEVVLPAATPIGVPVKKDINYYKSLIQQHGGEKQESLNNPISRDTKPKIMKPCIYFNSSRGCRHGANCAYQHDSSSQQRAGSLPEVQSAKRMKMDREITGT